ncbi:hypothetical protein [Legionella hackeliae]|uniref:Uncharacterized protein n=1 Tax=Legionella hackeliae TaxID=449 RepID=A0A0A8UTM0_LEGHA|nr:hypothetical protein [Legionella hackeliae]KTD12771.1 hypothetical protein Lhac_1642 [Legionella hackeliae]CEK12195.1 protein of unknown function [6 coiled coil domains] [Legionella hackeliae]STX48980.1 Uncharacterised protein [Legionella hackeliae]
MKSKSAKFPKKPVPIAEPNEALQKAIQNLKEEKLTLMDLITSLEKKNYRAVALNTDAKKLWTDIQRINDDLQQKLQVLESRLQAPKLMTNPQLLEQHLRDRNEFLHRTLSALNLLHENLETIEKDLFPDPKKINPQVFLEWKKAATELYVSVNDRVGEVKIALIQQDKWIQKAMEEDLKRLDSQVAQVKVHSEEIERIFKLSQKGVITAELYTDLANMLYTFSETAFEVMQTCKLFEERLAIFKQDQIIEELTTTLETTYSNLRKVYQLVVADRQQGELNAALRPLLMDESLHFSLSFAAEDFKLKTPTSSLQWSDSVSWRESIKAERQEILQQLEEKEKSSETILNVISDYQRQLKENIGEDIEFCLKRTAVIAAFSGRDSFIPSRLSKAINYDFRAAQPASEFEIHLLNLLLYASAVRLIQGQRQGIKDTEAQFLKDFPEVSTSNGSFSYKGQQYPLAPIVETIKHYQLARNRLNSALKDGDDNVSESIINYSQELTTIRDSKKAIETFIEDHLKEQHKIADDLRLLQSQLKSFEKIPLHTNSFDFQGAPYPVNADIRKDITGYNFNLEDLTKRMSGNLSRITLEELKSIQQQFTMLKKNRSEVKTYVENHISERADIAKRIQSLRQQFKQFSILPVENDFLTYQSGRYPLDTVNKPLVSQYNRTYEYLATRLEENLSQITRDRLGPIEDGLKFLQESKSKIEAHIEEQRKLNREVQMLRMELEDYSYMELRQSGGFIYQSTPVSFSNDDDIKTIVHIYNGLYNSLVETLDKAPPKTQRELSSLQQQYKTLKNSRNDIDRFATGELLRLGKERLLTEHKTVIEKLEKHRKLVTSKLELLDNIISTIEDEVTEIKKKYSEKDPRIQILTSLQEPFIQTKSDLSLLADTSEQAPVETNDLTALAKQVQAVQGTLKQFQDKNQKTTDTLKANIYEKFSRENLSKLTVLPAVLESLLQFINKMIPSLYKLLQGDEKSYKPGFFASSSEEKLFNFRKKLLPGLADLVDQQQKVEPPPV